jgi:hypothetical protein
LLTWQFTGVGLGGGGVGAGGGGVGAGGGLIFHEESVINKTALSLFLTHDKIHPPAPPGSRFVTSKWILLFPYFKFP